MSFVLLILKVKAFQKTKHKVTFKLQSANSRRENLPRQKRLSIGKHGQLPLDNSLRPVRYLQINFQYWSSYLWTGCTVRLNLTGNPSAAVLRLLKVPVCLWITVRVPNPGATQCDLILPIFVLFIFVRSSFILWAACSRHFCRRTQRKSERKKKEWAESSFLVLIF